MDNPEAFMSLYGARFYGFQTNPDTITAKKAGFSVPVTDYIPVGKDKLNLLQTREPIFWQVVKGLRQQEVS